MQQISDEAKGYPKESFCLAGHFRRDIESVLIPGGVISDRIERLACDVANSIGHESFTALCVLKGGYQFFSDLLDQIRQFYRFASFSEFQPPSPISTNRDSSESVSRKSPQQIRAEFIRVKSYENDASTGKVTITGITDLESLRGAVSLPREKFIL